MTDDSGIAAPSDATTADERLGAEPPSTSSGGEGRGSGGEGSGAGREGAATPARSAWSDGLGRTALRGLQVLIFVAVVTLLVYVLIVLRLVVVPLIIAIVIGAAVSPLVAWLVRRGMRRTWAALIALLIGVGLLVGVIWLVVSGVTRQWGALRSGVSDGLTQIETFLSTGPLPVTPEQIASGREAVTAFLSGETARSAAVSGALVAAEVITALFLTIVILFFLLKDGPRIWDFLQRPVPAVHRRRSERIGQRCVEVLGSYVRGTAVVATFDAILIGAALLVLDVPLAITLALLVFVGAFIPLAGATLTGALAALAALVFNGPVAALIVLAVVIVVNQLESHVLSPLVLGKAVALHPLVILLAIASGAIVAGIIGALLSVPLVAVSWTVITGWRDPDDIDRSADLARRRARARFEMLRRGGRRPAPVSPPG